MQGLICYRPYIKSTISWKWVQLRFAFSKHFNGGYNESESFSVKLFSALKLCFEHWAKAIVKYRNVHQTHLDAIMVSFQYTHSAIKLAMGSHFLRSFLVVYLLGQVLRIIFVTHTTCSVILIPTWTDSNWVVIPHFYTASTNEGSGTTMDRKRKWTFLEDWITVTTEENEAGQHVLISGLKSG